MNDALIDRFCDHLWLEDGLADLTLAAYRRDLRAFAGWLEKERQHGLGATVAGDIEAYLAWRFARRANLDRLASQLTNNETYFFREKEQLNAFAQSVLPGMVHRKSSEPQRTLRVLSAG